MKAIAIGTAAVVLGLIVLGAFIGGGAPPERDPNCGGGSGSAVNVNVANLPGSVGTFSGEQLEHAAIIINAGKKLGVSKRGQTIAVMTAIGESTLKNVKHGDSAGPDSRGLFQQRASGWGTEKERLNPHTAATNYYKALMDVSGWETLQPTIAAHKAQGNADPYHYEEYWPQAKTLVDKLSDAKVSEAKTENVGVGVGNKETARKSLSPGEAKKKYHLGPVKDVTARAVGVLAPQFGVKTVGGHRKSDPFPDHPGGLAADFMVPVNTQGQAKGDKLAKYLTEHHKEFGVKYLLWNQRSWYPNRGWKPMEDRGSRVANHENHVHTTFVSGADGANAALASDESTCAIAGGGASGSKASQIKGGWARPSEGSLTSDFGGRDSPCAGCSDSHKGIDLAAGCNQPIYAARAGTVIEVGPATGFGNWIRIDHGGGLITVYGHMFDDGLLAKVGDKVKAGEHIAKEGQNGVGSGCHLHFEVWQDGTKVDPKPVLNKSGIEVGA